VNRGTAHKWIERMLSGDYSYLGQPYFREESDNSFSPIGVLLDLLDKDGWDLKMGMWHWHGAHSEVAKESLKRGKVKTNDLTVQIGILPSKLNMIDNVHDLRLSGWVAGRYAPKVWSSREDNKDAILSFADASEWVLANYQHM